MTPAYVGSMLQQMLVLVAMIGAPPLIAGLVVGLILGVLQAATQIQESSLTIVPKLAKLQARTGILSCQFAGDRYRNWTIQFKETGSGFEILDFEYDEDAEGMDLDL